MASEKHQERPPDHPESLDQRFSFMFPSRQGKPRESGLTFIQADGPFYSVLNGDHLEQLLEYGGAWIDWYKFTVGACMFQPVPLVAEKIQLLDEHDVEAFPGGYLIEEAVMNGTTTELLDVLQEVGFSRVEISTNALDIERSEKTSLVEQAVERGFTVHGEVGGKKSGEKDLLGTEAVLDEMEEFLAAGADKVIFESDEFEDAYMGDRTDRESAESVVEEIDRAVGVENVMFEVPLTQEMVILDVVAWFINNVGPDVNLGNVNPNYLNLVEQMRRGIGMRV